jgi:hypothetical protein
VVKYDALEADPDYLVLGGYNRYGGLYDHWVESGDFRLIKEFPGYQIYQRVRRQ